MTELQKGETYDVGGTSMTYLGEVWAEWPSEQRLMDMFHVFQDDDGDLRRFPKRYRLSVDDGDGAGRFVTQSVGASEEESSWVVLEDALGRRHRKSVSETDLDVLSPLE